jgi:cysteine desulfurase
MSKKSLIYLDANASAPLAPSAKESIFTFLNESNLLLANPSSIHTSGRRAKKAIRKARECIAENLHEINEENLFFTSSGTESNQWIIRSVLEKSFQNKQPHWITTPIEHDSTLQMVRWFEDRGGIVSYIPVDSNGILNFEELHDLIQAKTALVSAIWVQNETGVINDIERLSSMTQSYGLPLHVDAIQAWGKIPIDLKQTQAQYMSFSSHKIGGLAGTGVIWTSQKNLLAPLFLGHQETFKRAGTENSLGIMSLAGACSDLKEDKIALVASLRDKLENAMKERIPGTKINGSLASRVANTSNLSFDGVLGDGLVMALDLEGYCVSAGSACSSGVLEPSHTLLAMGKTKAEAMAALRISLPMQADFLPSWQELDSFVNVLEKVVARIRNAVRKDERKK